MAQRQQRRRRKHKGTQGGTVRRRRPTSRAQSRGTAESRRVEKLSRPPTWSGSITRGAIAAGALFLLLAVILRQGVAQALTLSAAAMLVYVPAFHTVDSILYRRRQARRSAEDGDTPD